MTPLVFLMGVGPLARWKEAALPDLARRLRWALGVEPSSPRSLAPLAAGQWTPLRRVRPAARVLDRRVDRHGRVRERGSSRGRRHRFSSSRRQPRATGAWSSRTSGIAVFIVGVTMVKGYETERDVQDGRRRHGGRRRLRVPLRRRDASNAARTTRRCAARSRSAANGALVTHAATRRSASTTRAATPMTEAAIDSGLVRRPLRLAGRAGRQRRVGRARLRQALRQLDLGRLPPDGAAAASSR